MKKIATGLLLGSLGMFLGGEAAVATTTEISPGALLDSAGGILDQIYGLGNLQRIDDDLDKIWSPAIATATTRAMRADFAQEFGYIPDLNSDNVFDEAFVPLFTMPGVTYEIGLDGPGATFDSGAVDFLMALKSGEEPLWTSQPDENSDSLDHMVTWLITGNEGNPENVVGNHVIAWEDLQGGGDRDFDDLVVEVNVGAVPIPAAIWLFGSGVLGLVGIARRKTVA